MAYYASGDCSAMISVMKPRFSVSVFLFMLAGRFCLPARTGLRLRTLARRPDCCPPAAESRAVIERLSGLHNCRTGLEAPCRDLAHGEAVGLDESGWQVITRGARRQ